MSIKRVTKFGVVLCSAVVWLFCSSGSGATAVAGQGRRSASPARRVAAARPVVRTVEAPDVVTGGQSTIPTNTNTTTTVGRDPSTAVPTTPPPSATAAEATSVAPLPGPTVPVALSGPAAPTDVAATPLDPVWITPPAGSGGSGRPGPATSVWVSTGTTLPARGPGRCVVFLHGKGGSAGTRSVRDGIVRVAPGGNSSSGTGGAGTLQWNYTESTDYAAARALIETALAGDTCGQIVVAGFSNGGALAAKFLCRSETLSDRLVGVVLEDPVPDHVVDGCSPAAGVRNRLVQSDWMNSVAGSGRPCPTNWICDGTLYGLADYAAKLSPMTTNRVADHNPVDDVAFASTLWRS